MGKLEEWLAQRGPTVAVALDEQHEAICAMVSSCLAATFPALCYDPARPDALAFQQHMFRETPRRFHRLMQVVLLFQTLEIIAREYRWGWPIISRYGVQRRHMRAQVSWYFEAIYVHVGLLPGDSAAMRDLAATVLQIVEQAIANPQPLSADRPIRKNGFHL